MKAVTDKIILCRIGNDSDLNHEPICSSQEINLMLSGYPIRFFPYDIHSDLYRTRKNLDSNFGNTRQMPQSEKFSDLPFDEDFLCWHIRLIPDLCPRFSLSAPS